MKNLIISTFTLLLFISACQNDTVVQKKAENSEYIEITRDQFDSEQMTLGLPEKMALEEMIYFSGVIVPKINGIAEITAPVEGIVQDVKVYRGQLVKADDQLLKIGGTAFIELQQEFATSAAKIKQLKAGYERTKALYDENIKTENEYLVAESDYKSELANYNALKLRLKQIGLDVKGIENGNYYAFYCLTSPINGQISRLSALTGQYINREDEIAEIVDKENVELQLSFYEKDFPKIAVGQNVVFGGLSENEYKAHAIISRLGAKLNTYSNSLECFAEINKDDADLFVINQKITGEVTVMSDSVFVIPQSSIVSEANKKFIIVKVNETSDGYQFEKQLVEIGNTNDDFVEIVNFDNDREILIKGVQSIEID